MRTIVKVDIQTYQILYKVGVYIYNSESIDIRFWKHIRIQIGTQESGVYRKGNTGMLCRNMEQEQELEQGLNLRW